MKEESDVACHKDDTDLYNDDAAKLPVRTDGECQTLTAETGDRPQRLLQEEGQS